MDESAVTGAARIALASLWCAAVAAPDVFGAPRFRFAGPDLVCDAKEAARYLVAQRQIGRPVHLTPGIWDGNALEAIATIAAVDDGPGLEFEACLPDTGNRMLIVAGGRGLRVSRSMLQILDADYRVIVRRAAGGSPPDHPWTINLALPAPWLEGVDFVLLFGAGHRNAVSSPLRMGSGFDPELFEDLEDLEGL